MKRKSKHQYKKNIQQSHLKSLNTKNHGIWHWKSKSQNMVLPYDYCIY